MVFDLPVATKARSTSPFETAPSNREDTCVCIVYGGPISFRQAADNQFCVVPFELSSRVRSYVFRGAELVRSIEHTDIDEQMHQANPYHPKRRDIRFQSGTIVGGIQWR